MKIIKKLLKIFMFLAIAFALLCVGAVVAFKVMYPPAKLKLMAQQYVRENLKREVDFSSVSLNFIGVTIKDFKLSERSTFAQGTFVEAKKAIIKLEAGPLLHKKIAISALGFDGLNVNVTKNENGKFNFDDLLSAAPEAAGQAEAKAKDDSEPMDLVADNIFIKNSSVNYTDKMSGSKFSVRQVNFNTDHFDFTQDFDFSASALTDIKTESVNLPSVKISFNGKANLASMNMPDGSLNLQDFSLAYKTAAINFKGSVNNFDNPSIVLKGALSGIDSNLLSEFTTSPSASFTLPQIDIESNTLTDIEHGTTKINNLRIGIGQSYLSADGNLDYSTPQFKYNILANGSVTLSELGQIARDLLGRYNLSGTIGADISAQNAPKAGADSIIKANLTLDGVGAKFDSKTLRNVNGTVTINSLNDIRTNLITGLFTDSPFKTSLQYVKRGRVSDVNLFFNLDKYTLDDIDFSAPSKPAAKETAKSSSAAQKAPAQKQRGEAFNIKADISVGKVANNIFTSDTLALTADVKNFDNIMDRAQGTINFSAKNGEIKDIDKLMSSSTIAKVLFTSVRVVQKALNFIKMDKLSIGLDKITYSSVVGQYSLANGALTINKSEINSDLTTVKALGNINLITEQLDMKLESHLGKVGASGFKPVVVKVGGTISDPSYKLDVVSTVASVVNLPAGIVKGGVGLSTGIVKGVAAGTGEIVKGAAGGTATIVKGVAGSIGGLFKKKDSQTTDGGK